MNIYLTRCRSCGRNTNRKYAREHDGQCKACVEPASRKPTRNERILESGYLAYALEEDHFGYSDR